tara:strand:- start:1121 stop:1711 length:591 start_codon:yes stop_codon:yes gene_type:complete
MALTRLGLNQAVNLSTNTTGTLGVANGGTGLSSGTADQYLKFTGTTTLASSVVSAGKVLQAVTTESTANVTSTTTSFVTMNFNVQITPSAATSKILVLFNSGLGYQNTSNQNFYSYYTLYRDTTNLGAGNSGIQGVYYHTVTYNDIFSHANFQKLDSPNTTSQITYTPYVRVSTTDADLDTRLEGQHNITALEIAA